MNEYATNGDASGQTPRIDELRYITWHSVGCTRLHPLDDKLHRCSSLNDSDRNILTFDQSRGYATIHDFMKGRICGRYEEE